MSIEDFIDELRALKTARVRLIDFDDSDLTIITIQLISDNSPTQEETSQDQEQNF